MNIIRDWSKMRSQSSIDDLSRNIMNSKKLTIVYIKITVSYD